MARRLGPLVGVALAIAAGAALRLIFPTDIEWKADEQWSYLHAAQMLRTGAWPPVGMPSSVGAPNPGLSLWVFAGLDRLFDVRSPPDLARAVAMLNIAALVAFAAFAVTRKNREPWLWAVALWAVNPVAIILERKIWPPSTLPLAAVALYWAWTLRRRWPAAFVWGALGALMAQVHMGVALLALALAAWTFASDGRAFPWRAWLAGSLAGVLPAIPWLLAMAGHGAGARIHLTAPSVSFYMRWATQFLGYGAQYTLGKAGFADFLAGPRIAGLATHLLGALQAVLIILAIVALVRGARTLVGKGGALPVRTLLLGDSDETVLITAALWGYGGLLTLTTFVGAGSYRHYMIVITPIMALWTATAVLWSDGGWKRGRARAILAALCVGQAALSLGLLDYLHREGGVRGEFGVSWRAQQPGYVAPDRQRRTGSATRSSASAPFSHARNSGVCNRRSA